jgi:membrane protease YdiL (CAAX protease family)
VTERRQLAFGDPGYRARIPPLWLQPFAWAAVLAAGLLAALGVIALRAALAGPISADDLSGDWRLMVTGSLAWLGGSAGAALAWIRYIERRPLASAGAPPLGGVRLGPGPLLRGAGWAFIGTLLVVLLGHEMVDMRALLRPLVTQPVLALLTAAVLLPLVAFAAAAEEVMFRGWLLSTLSVRLGLLPAVGVSSILFASLHVYPSEWLQPAAALSAAGYVTIAAAFCFIALRDGHLYGSAAFHTGFNAFAFYVALLQADFRPEVVGKMLAAPRAYEAPSAAAAFAALQLILALVLYNRWRDARR